MVGGQDDGGVESEGESRAGAERVGTQLSDVALVVAVARGHRDALAEMYERHGAKAYGLARRVCGEDLAPEVVQQVFLEMWARPHRYNPDRGSLGSFLLTQVHGRSVDRLRSDGTRRARETASAAARVTTEVDLETTVVSRSAGEKVRGLLHALPASQRDAIVLAYFKGYTYRDVADLLGEPEGTIKSRIRAGLARLRLALCEEGYQTAGSLL
jgi:RNA polymerase sigma-70 factor (ECF subfamily)